MSSDNVIRIRKHLHDELSWCELVTPTGVIRTDCVIRETQAGKYEMIAGVGQQLDHEGKKRTVQSIVETEHYWELRLNGHLYR